MKKPIVNSNHYLALIVSAFILVCSAGAFFFFYYQVEAQIVKTEASYQQIAQDRIIEGDAQSVVDILAQTQQERGRLQTFFVPDDQTVSFITQIEATGKEAGKATVTIVSISDDDISAGPVGSTGNIHAHINISGGWTDAMRALHLLESLPYGESIDNVRATPASGTTWNISFDLTAVMIHSN